MDTLYITRSDQRSVFSFLGDSYFFLLLHLYRNINIITYYACSIYPDYTSYTNNVPGNVLAPHGATQLTVTFKFDLSVFSYTDCWSENGLRKRPRDFIDFAMKVIRVELSNIYSGENHARWGINFYLTLVPESFLSRFGCAQAGNCRDNYFKSASMKGTVGQIVPLILYLPQLCIHLHNGPFITLIFE